MARGLGAGALRDPTGRNLLTHGSLVTPVREDGRLNAARAPRFVAHAVGAALLALLVAMLVLAPALREGARFGIRHESGRLTIVDFSAHLVFARSVWMGHAEDATRAGSAYSTGHQLDVTSAWAGEPIRVALPFGYSPTMLWLLAPFAALPNHLAFALWGVLSWIAAWWLSRPSRITRGAGIAVFLCPVGLACFQLGQTACLAAAALLVVARGAERTDRDARTWLGLDATQWSAVLALWALTAKPPIAIAAGVALLALGSGRIVAWALGLALVGALAATPWLGAGWPADYVALVSAYDRLSADPAFGWSLVPERMSTLRALLAVDFGVPDPLASRVSTFAWLASLAALGIVGRRAGPREAPHVWASATLGYLALFPHVTATEVLLVSAPLALYVGADSGPDSDANQTPTRTRWLRLAGLAVLPLLSPSVGPLAGARWPQFALLIGLAVALRPRPAAAAP